MEVNPAKLSEYRLVAKLKENIEVALSIVESAGIVVEVVEETTKGQQSGLSFTHPMKAA